MFGPARSRARRRELTACEAHELGRQAAERGTVVDDDHLRGRAAVMAVTSRGPRRRFRPEATAPSPTIAA